MHVLLLLASIWQPPRNNTPWKHSICSLFPAHPAPSLLLLYIDRQKLGGVCRNLLHRCTVVRLWSQDSLLYRNIYPEVRPQKCRRIFREGASSFGFLTGLENPALPGYCTAQNKQSCAGDVYWEDAITGGDCPAHKIGHVFIHPQKKKKCFWECEGASTRLVLGTHGGKNNIECPHSTWNSGFHISRWNVYTYYMTMSMLCECLQNVYSEAEIERLEWTPLRQPPLCLETWGKLRNWWAPSLRMCRRFRTDRIFADGK